MSYLRDAIEHYKKNPEEWRRDGRYAFIPPITGGLSSMAVSPFIPLTKGYSNKANFGRGALIGTGSGAVLLAAKAKGTMEEKGYPKLNLITYKKEKEMDKAASVISSIKAGLKGITPKIRTSARELTNSASNAVSGLRAKAAPTLSRAEDATARIIRKSKRVVNPRPTSKPLRSMPRARRTFTSRSRSAITKTKPASTKDIIRNIFRSQ